MDKVITLDLKWQIVVNEEKKTVVDDGIEDYFVDSDEKLSETETRLVSNFIAHLQTTPRIKMAEFEEVK